MELKNSIYIGMEEEPKEILTIEIPFDTDIYEWTRSKDGKQTIFPELLIGCEEMIYGNVDKMNCMNVISYESGRPETIEFVVRIGTVDRTLSKILQWAVDNEYYENECVRIRELQAIIKNRKELKLQEIEQSAEI